MQLNHEAHQSCLFSAEVKNEWRGTFTPLYAFMAPLPLHFVGAVQLLLRSGTGRILLQNGHERHAHKANSEVVMSL